GRPMAKKGASNAASTNRTRPCFHQSRTRITAGVEQATVLLRSAAAKSRSDVMYQARWISVGQTFLSVIVEDRQERPSHPYARIDSSAKHVDSRFFRSLIHATDSTSIGCNANTTAASAAPGTSSRRS